MLNISERRFVDSSRRAVLATQAPDGRPRLVPICFALSSPRPDGVDRLYTPIDEKPKRSLDPHDLARVRDILAHPAVTVLVDRWSEDWAELEWLRLEGDAEMLEPGDAAGEHRTAVALLRSRYPQYAGQDLDARPVLRIVVTRVLRWAAGPADS